MSEEHGTSESGGTWFTIPALGLLPEVNVPKPPSIEVRTFAEGAKDRVTATVQDVRKNVGHTVVLIREVVGV